MPRHVQTPVIGVNHAFRAPPREKVGEVSKNIDAVVRSFSPQTFAITVFIRNDLITLFSQIGSSSFRSYFQFLRRSSFFSGTLSRKRRTFFTFQNYSWSLIIFMYGKNVSSNVISALYRDPSCFPIHTTEEIEHKRKQRRQILFSVQLPLSVLFMAGFSLWAKKD